MQLTCPRCQTKFTAEVGADPFFLCPGCGARLAHRKPAAAPSPPQATERLKAAVATVIREKGAGDPGADFDPGRTELAKDSGPAPPTVASSPPAEPSGPPPVTAESSLEELLFALYQTQQQLVELLQTRLGRGRVTPEPPGRESKDAVEGAEFMAFPPAPARARKRKSVLLVDDDETTRDNAVAALQQADVPVRTAANANEALAALSREMPDVIALEVELSGDPDGRELIQRVKATIEWVAIPIVLYTRARVQSREEARTEFGADAFVLKGPRGPAALVSQVITLFRAAR